MNHMQKNADIRWQDAIYKVKLIVQIQTWDILITFS